MHAVQFMSTASPILHAFLFQNKQLTVYKFSIFYKHANPNNQPYYYIITFTQYTKKLKVHKQTRNLKQLIKVRNKIKHRQKVQNREISDTLG
jgi:type VI protein secretion system component Hcp